MKTLNLFLLIISFSTAFSQSEFIELWPNKVPSQAEEKSAYEVAPDQGDGIMRISKVTNPQMEVRKPDPDKDNGNVVLICPGGGYWILAYDHEGTIIADWFAERGFTAYVLQYRVPQNRKGAFQDAQRAMRILRGIHGKDAKIGIMGFSAGGNLAAQVSTRFLESSYQRINKEDRLSAKPDFSILIYPAYLDKGMNFSLSPELSLSPYLSPVFIFGTSDDLIMSGAMVYAGAMIRNKTPVDIHVLPEGGHGFSMKKDSKAGQVWPGLMEKWLLTQGFLEK